MTEAVDGGIDSRRSRRGGAEAEIGGVEMARRMVVEDVGTGSGSAARSRRCMRTIVHVSLELSVGGQEKLLVDFAKHRDRSRFTMHFVALGGGGLVADELRSLGEPVTLFGQPSGVRPSLSWALWRLFRRVSADVVHTHDARSLIHAAPAARLAWNSKVLHTNHGRCLHSTKRRQTLVRRASRLVDRFVCVSEDLAKESLADGVAPKRVRTILNGVDVDRFGVQDPSVDGPVVAVGRLSPEKDHLNLIEAAAIAREWGRPFDVVIVGDGPCMPELTARVEALDLGGRVRLPGVSTDVAEFLSHAGVFVLPSKTEGISLTLLEAMASRLATVATAVGGNPEVVVAGETGLLVPHENPRALAEAILSLTPEMRRSMGESGRRRVEDHFSIKRMISEYESLYEE